MSTGPDAVVVEAISSRAWGSLTFTGERHHLVLRVPVESDVALGGLQFDVPGSIVAVERAVWTAGPRLTVDLLAIDDEARPRG